MLENILKQLGYEKEQSRRYVKYRYERDENGNENKKPLSVIFQYNCNRACSHGELQPQITVAMLSDELTKFQESYVYACENDAKFFFLGEYGEKTWSEPFVQDRFLRKYIYSIEIIEDVKSGNFDMTSVIQSFRKNQKDIMREHVTNKINNFYAVLIKVREDDDEITSKYLDFYLEASDSRTYSQSVCKHVNVEYIEKDDSMVKETNDPYNLLIYGAPGTGKSRYIDDKLNCISEHYEIRVKPEDDLPQDEIKNIEDNIDKAATFMRKFVNRVTFYEDYSYENFVGCYKPAPSEDDERVIVYKYEPGPFIETYTNAKNDPENNYFLVIEELNRAKAASVFGDMFQLLDRKNGVSEYAITPEPALRNYLEEHIDGDAEKTTMKLPNNMYIWATMNSADQGVFSLDSAFKRRWSFLYKDIDAPKQSGVQKICLVKKIENGNPINGEVRIDDFRRKINDVILTSGRDEDRCIGPWFFTDDELHKVSEYTRSDKFDKDEKGHRIRKEIENPLVDKLFAYLRQDVFRMDSDVIFKDDEGKCNMSTIRKMVADNKPISEILRIDLEEKLWSEPEEDKPKDEEHN